MIPRNRFLPYRLVSSPLLSQRIPACSTFPVSWPALQLYLVSTLTSLCLLSWLRPASEGWATHPRPYLMAQSWQKKLHRFLYKILFPPHQPQHCLEMNIFLITLLLSIMIFPVFLALLSYPVSYSASSLLLVSGSQQMIFVMVRWMHCLSFPWSLWKSSFFCLCKWKRNPSHFLKISFATSVLSHLFHPLCAGVNS